jgi:uncharacterized membrane protein
MGVMMIPAMAVLFWESGRLIGKANPNYTIGIRTPWTLASDEVWKRTHILGEKIFKVAAVVALVGMIDRVNAFWWIIVPTMMASLGMIGYSAVIYHKQK